MTATTTRVLGRRYTPRHGGLPELVDELRLVIAPTIAGSGRRLFDGVPPLQLESIASETSPTGSLLVHYKVRH
jgi:riboflavin biosynthesis pyrimidine reductase